MVYTSLVSNVKSVIKDIERSELINRKKAAAYLARKMRKNISDKGVSRPGGFPGYRTGALRKSVRSTTPVKSPVSFVGTRSPLAHLLEFGHGDGKTKNKRPFFNRTFEEEKDNIINILAERYF